MEDKKPNKVYVLTYEVNQYDQYGRYFVAVFKGIPSLEDLAKVMSNQDWNLGNVMEAVAFLEHLRKGGGRRGVEDQWYYLDEVDLL